jgi:hypothetical protein
MAGKCKVCFSPLRETIESRLLKGDSIATLSEWLATQGESISAPSIQRHKVNHFEPTRLENVFLGTTPLNTVENAATGDFEAFIDTAAVMDQITKELIDTDVFASVINERKFTQLLIEKIVQKQLIIVHELQDQYSAGKCGYPDSQIRGLKTILDIANSLPTYKNDKLLREIRVDNQNSYENRIVQTAKELAATENAKYKTWYVLKTKPALNPPHDKINEYAKKIYTGNDGYDAFERKKWIDETIEKWERALARELSDQYNSENHIRSCIDYHTDEFCGVLTENECEKLDSRIIEKIIVVFETPTNAAADYNDQALNDLICDELPVME